MITSFFVNCVVPAKMGDIYRGYLAKQKLDVPVSKALGTIIAERLIDLIVLMALLLAAGAVVFRTKAPGILVPYVVIGVVVCLAGVGVILVMRAGRGQRILRLLPEAVFHRYESLRLGTVELVRTSAHPARPHRHGLGRGGRATRPRGASRCTWPASTSARHSSCSSPWWPRCSPPFPSSPAGSGWSRPA